MSGFFKFLLHEAGRIDSSAALHSAVSQYIDSLQDLPGWTFQHAVESTAIAELAQQKPDILVQSAYLWNAHLNSLGRRPRTYQADLYAMKRAIADGLAEIYSVIDTHGADNTLRVAILVPYLPNNPNNNILRVLAGYLGGLHRLGVKAVLVLTNEMSFPTGIAIPTGRNDPRPYRSMIEGVIGEYDAPADALYIAPPPFLEVGNLNWHLSFLESFRPNLVFFPNFEMSCAHIHGFGRSAATVYLQTSVRNRPPYEFTRYLYLGARREIDATHINPEKWHYHTFGYGNFGAGSSLTRADIGVDEIASLVVTAGNRLETEIDKELGSIMRHVMKKCPDVVWMLLGVQDEAKIRKNLGWDGEEIANRLICKGYIREIGDYLSLSDIYANPRRTGGAVSMALAVYGKTPVLSYNGNDACNFLIEEMMHETADSYREKLLDLIGDKAVIARVAHEQAVHFDANHTIENSSRDLLKHFNAALKEH